MPAQSGRAHSSPLPRRGSGPSRGGPRFAEPHEEAASTGRLSPPPRSHGPGRDQRRPAPGEPGLLADHGQPGIRGLLTDGARLELGEVAIVYRREFVARDASGAGREGFSRTDGA